MKRVAGLSGLEEAAAMVRVLDLPLGSRPLVSRGTWILAATVSSEVLFLGLMASSGKIPPVVFKIFRALLTF